MIPTADFLFLVYQVTVERAKKSFLFVIRLSKYLKILKIRLTHIFHANPRLFGNLVEGADEQLVVNKT